VAKPVPDEIDTLKAINQHNVRTANVWVSPVGSEAVVQVALDRRADVGRVMPLHEVRARARVEHGRGTQCGHERPFDIRPKIANNRRVPRSVRVHRSAI
jgi:hypothetical protein